jgi:predicted transcriptional regulator
MTDRLRELATLELIAAQLSLHRADRLLKQCTRNVSISTVHRVFQGGDHRISTLIDIADALGCDVVITIEKRVA